MDEVSYLIVAGTIAMLLMLISVISFVILHQKRIIRHQLEIKLIENTKQRELLEASIKSEEDERRRIASELHDDTAATLASISLLLYDTDDGSETPENIIQSRQLLNESIDQVRNISHRLHPSSLQYLGLEAALKSFTKPIDFSQKVKIHYDPDNVFGSFEFDTELSIYRIVQELIINIVKHSNARYIDIWARLEKEAFLLKLQHDGSGLTQSGYEALVCKEGSLGLKNVTQRLQILSGKLQFIETDAHKFHQLLSIPMSLSKAD